MMRGKGYLFKWYVALFLVFLYAPAILLPVFAFNDSSIVSFPLKGFTTKWFEVLQSTEALHVAVRNSLMIAVTTAVVSTIFGVLACAGLDPLCLSRSALHHGFHHAALWCCLRSLSACRFWS
jgi:ABC-type spermidine/putrescine transport system permease subunit II